jgi:hypothetical protein
MKSLIQFAMLAGIAMALMGCSGQDESKEPEVKPRETPTFDARASVSTQPAATSPAPQASTRLPAGHPPIASAAPSAGDAGPLKLQMPAEFQEKPARMMTLQVYAAPKVEGDPEDADVAVSTLGTKVPLTMNVDRWCSQFDFPEGQTCDKNKQQQKLEGTTHPTTLVEITGTYKGSSMMAAPSAPKPGYKMLAAEIVTPEAPYYVKVVGPIKTVDRWREPLIDAIKAAK